jgi:hypothetical protein
MSNNYFPILALSIAILLGFLWNSGRMSPDSVVALMGVIVIVIFSGFMVRLFYLKKSVIHQEGLDHIHRWVIKLAIMIAATIAVVAIELLL